MNNIKINSEIINSDINNIKNYYDKISKISAKILEDFFKSKNKITKKIGRFSARSKLFNLNYLKVDEKIISIINIFSEDDDSFFIDKKIFDSSFRADIYIPVYVNLDTFNATIKGYFNSIEIEDYSCSSNDAYKIYFSDINDIESILDFIEITPDFLYEKNEFETNENIEEQKNYLSNVITLFKNNSLDVEQNNIYSLFEEEFYGILADEENSNLFLELQDLLEQDIIKIVDREKIKLLFSVSQENKIKNAPKFVSLAASSKKDNIIISKIYDYSNKILTIIDDFFEMSNKNNLDSIDIKDKSISFNILNISKKYMEKTICLYFTTNKILVLDDIKLNDLQDDTSLIYLVLNHFDIIKKIPINDNNIILVKKLIDDDYLDFFYKNENNISFLFKNFYLNIIVLG